MLKALKVDQEKTPWIEGFKIPRWLPSIKTDIPEEAQKVSGQNTKHEHPRYFYCYVSAKKFLKYICKENTNRLHKNAEGISLPITFARKEAYVLISQNWSQLFVPYIMNFNQNNMDLPFREFACVHSNWHIANTWLFEPVERRITKTAKLAEMVRLRCLVLVEWSAVLITFLQIILWRSLPLIRQAILSLTCWYKESCTTS